MRTVRIAAWMMLLVAISAGAQTPRDRKLIAYAKALPVSKLDASLPAVPFEQWLQKEAGKDAQIAWEVNDCGEQTGSAEDAGRDFPMCVEADAQLHDKRVIVISIVVGTYRAGISGKPAVWWITVGRDPNRDQPLESLGEVPERLMETRDLAPAGVHPPKKPAPK